MGRRELLRPDPRDRLVRNILGEVVPLLRGLVRLDRLVELVERRVPLVRLAADETVEVLEPTSGVRPAVERTHRARLPHGHLVALAELRRVVAVQLQGLGQRGAGVRSQRVVTGRRRGDLGDATHAHGVVVAAGEHRCPGGRAQTAVVWKRENLSPPAASRSATGVLLIGPPKAEDAPKPTSSMRITSTLGAPGGGRTWLIGGNEVAGSLASKVTRPWWTTSGIGRALRLGSRVMGSCSQTNDCPSPLTAAPAHPGTVRDPWTVGSSTATPA